MNKEEIVKALRVCGNGESCLHCPYCNIAESKLRCNKKDTEAADLIEAQAAEIEKLKAQVPRWIPAADKIPPDQEEVLVLTQSKNGVRNVDKGYWAIDHFIHRGRSEVTHWMPLPERPKTEVE